MSTVKVKICGITNREDALAAVDAGVDALGFIFAESPRRISPEAATAIITMLPPFISTVGVFVNEAPETIDRIVRKCGLHYVQFHGEESPGICNRLGRRAIRAIRVKNEESLESLDAYRVCAFLLDSYTEGTAGGTGKVFRWELATHPLVRDKRIILSGGLNPGNVVEAVRKVRPYAVDVCSGVELSPGQKDPCRMKEFISNAKHAYFGK